MSAPHGKGNGGLAQRVRELERQNLELGQTVQLIEQARCHYVDHFDFAPVGCLTFDGHGCIREINLAAAKLLGRVRARLIDMPLFTFVAKSHLPVFFQHLRTCEHTTERVESEVALSGKGHGHRLVSLSSVPVIDERTERMLYRTAILDVTERRRAEDALRHSEERFSKAFHASPSSISIATLAEGRFIDVNASFCKLTGFRRSEVIGHTAPELRIYAEEGFREKVIAELHEKRTIQNRDGRVRTKSGTICEVLMSAEIIELDGEQCILTIGQDVSDLKRLEREVLEISEREQRRIGQDLHDDACQSLTGIAMRAEVAARQLGSGHPESAALVREIATMLRDSIDRVRRLASGLFPIKVEHFGLAWALHELASETSERCSIHCVFTMPHPIEISDRAVSMQLYRIAQEAVSNALRHGRAAEIALGLESAGGRVRFTVRDNGVGFAPQKRKKETGLGLHTMRYRATMIGGTLEIDKTLEGGTLVACSFPEPEVSHADKNHPEEEDFPR